MGSSSKSYVRREQKEIASKSQKTQTERKIQNVMNNCYKSTHYPQYDNMIHLKGSGENEKYDLSFHYTLLKNQGTLKAHMEYKGLGYISWGVSSDGMMVPGDAIIGLPDEANSQTNPGKYSMLSKTLAGVKLMDNQNLMNGVISQDTAFTNLTFTKFLVEDSNDEEFTI